MKTAFRLLAVALLASVACAAAGCTSFSLGSSVHYHYYPCGGQGACGRDAADAPASPPPAQQP